MIEIPGSQPPVPDPSQPTASAQANTPSAATLAAPAAPPYALSAAQAPTSAYAPYPQAMYPSQKKGTSALKIVLIIVGIVVGLGVIAVGAAGVAFYKFAKSSNMTTSSQPATAADLSVPPYPGSLQGKSLRMTMMGNDMITANFLTSDSRDQVIAFYRNSLGPGAADITSFNAESLKLEKGAGESVMVTVSDQLGGIGGKTQITIVHITKAASSSN